MNTNHKAEYAARKNEALATVSALGLTGKVAVLLAEHQLCIPGTGKRLNVANVAVVSQCRKTVLVDLATSKIRNLRHGTQALQNDYTLWLVQGERGVNEHDFFCATTADFTTCEMPAGEPDFVSDSGSVYYYRDGGVVRVSDHWGIVASCRWTFDGNGLHSAACRKYELRAAFCKFANFNRI